MTTKVILFTRPDGGVSVVNPAPEFVASFPTEAEALVAIQAKSVPSDATDIEIVERAVLPTQRVFRDAWVKKIGGAEVDMPRARIIHLDRIRVVRDMELAALDVLFMRAIEVRDDVEQARLATLKQALRDIPQTFDLLVYTTPETLKAARPPELTQRMYDLAIADGLIPSEVP